MAGPSIDEIVVADDPKTWTAAGFRLEGDALAVGSVRIRLAGRGPARGIIGWSVRGLAGDDLDGLPTEASSGRPGGGAGGGAAEPHPNGAEWLDHLVAFTPHLDRTVAALEAVGLELRRRRDGPTPGGAERQALFRLGEVVLEAIEAPPGTRIREDPGAPARFWGLAFGTADLDASVAALGGLLGEPRPAVQPGRRIATLRKEAGLGRRGVHHRVWGPWVPKRGV